MMNEKAILICVIVIIFPQAIFAIFGQHLHNQINIHRANPNHYHHHHHHHHYHHGHEEYYSDNDIPIYDVINEYPTKHEEPEESHTTTTKKPETTTTKKPETTTTTTTKPETTTTTTEKPTTKETHVEDDCDNEKEMKPKVNEHNEEIYYKYNYDKDQEQKYTASFVPEKPENSYTVHYKIYSDGKKHSTDYGYIEKPKPVPYSDSHIKIWT